MALGDKCFPLVVDNTKLYAVITTVVCAELWFREQMQQASYSYRVFEPLQTSAAIDKAAGQEHIFKNAGGLWPAGATVGYVELDAGSFTAMIEQK